MYFFKQYQVSNHSFKKIILYSYANNTEPRFECENQFGTRKWPITLRLPFSNWFLFRRNKKKKKNFRLRKILANRSIKDSCGHFLKPLNIVSVKIVGLYWLNSRPPNVDVQDLEVTALGGRGDEREAKKTAFVGSVLISFVWDCSISIFI